MEDAGYTSDPALVRIFPGVPEALARLKEAGFRTALITNQSGIGRGYFTEADYHAVAAEFLRQLGPGLLDASYYCPDAPGSPSARRKPEPAMVLEAASDLGIDLARSWFIGDKAIDVECGRRAGTRTILVLTGEGRAQQNAKPDFCAEDITDAVRIVLES
jgi:D-glycero-D-manno-heptose 1,7-bisphosphate phosphatase